MCTALNENRDSSLWGFSTNCCTTGPCGLASRVRYANTEIQVRNYGVYGASVEFPTTLYTGPTHSPGIWSTRTDGHQANIYNNLISQTSQITDYVIELGYNDALNAFERLLNHSDPVVMARRAQFTTNYEQIINDLRNNNGQNARFYCMNVPPNRDAEQEAIVNTLILQVASNNNCTLVDISTLLDLEYPDGTHPDMSSEISIATTLLTVMSLN